ncbi:TRAP transporter large permease [Paracoccus sp. R12_1]|uniref:TRAP transporter large permease n=1 Tax=unclassified Paracoccus (in: a-proteobacteria) TaxID=2688777 RepID=UPI001ADB3916|nr:MULTISPECIES: TRAP transporter large permease [unclassified Paracoccus (in: a-proteobacteria)]MBO9456701.1 TRAP transporter large permease [Paracoccus sp. R12_2]MBO9487797.1 TRAP transporter large permease [Paracoccus sp. R12_1]
MDPANIGVALLILTLSLLALRVPLALVLGGVGAVGTFLIHATSGGGIFDVAMNWTGPTLLSTALDLPRAGDLAIVPLVILLGNIAFYAGIATRIYDAAAIWLRPLRGGLAMAAVVGCGGFSAISGSSVACASTMGRICAPEMLRLGYDPRLATASVAVGGTLGSLIPPSVLFILFGIFTETSIARLFLAGVLPGLLSLAGMMAVVAWWVGQNPKDAPPGTVDKASRIDAALAIWPALLLFAMIVGGILLGFSATAAVAACVMLTLVIGFTQSRLTADVLWQAIRESLLQSAAILVIVVAAKVFFGFVILTGLPDAALGWAQDAALSYFVMIAVVIITYLILGMFLEPIAILILTLPFLLPLVEAYGMDPIWFGVIVVKLLEIGLITPPVGLNVFVIGNVTRDVGIDRIFAGVSRFLAIDVLVLLILILFPIISTILAGAM